VDAVGWSRSAWEGACATLESKDPARRVETGKLEKPADIRYKIQDIRTLVGHKTDLSQVKVRPAVRLEKGDD